MISRRIIRIKVLQLLYAYNTAPEKSISNAEQELFFSIRKTYDLYHHLLQLPAEIVSHAQSTIELRKKKHFPTQEDLNPNMRFINNSVIAQLDCNEALNEYLNKSKANWRNEPELIKKLYSDLSNAPFFIEYMSLEGNDYSEDKKLLEGLFKEVIMPSDDLYHFLEDQSIYWNDDIEFVVSMILKTLKKFKERSDGSQELLPLFKDEDDRLFARDLFRKCILNHEALKEIVRQHTINWDVERIAIIDNLILELAIAEFLYFPSIPTKVTLDEYIELSKYYSTQKSHNFINGILDKSLRALKQEDKVVKTGRGLIGE